MAGSMQSVMLVWLGHIVRQKLTTLNITCKLFKHIFKLVRHIGTIDMFHFISYSVALTFAESGLVSRKLIL